MDVLLFSSLIAQELIRKKTFSEQFQRSIFSVQLRYLTKGVHPQQISIFQKTTKCNPQTIAKLVCHNNYGL